MAPIPKDEPVERGEDSSSESIGDGDIVYVNDLTDSDDGEELEVVDQEGGYVMLSQGSGGAASDCESEVEVASAPEQYVDVNVDRLLHVLDVQEQMQFTAGPFSSNCAAFEERPPSPSVWTQTVRRPAQTSPEQAATIMAAMKGFSLPPHSIPGWAATVPEAAWKEQLIGRIRNASSTGSEAATSSEKTQAEGDSPLSSSVCS